MLAVLSPIFVTGTKIIFDYNFVAPLMILWHEIMVQSSDSKCLLITTE